MANRHSNKKLRAMTLHRMAQTGESFQSARKLVRARSGCQGRGRHLGPAADFVETRYFGEPITLAILPAPMRAPLIVWLSPPRARLAQPRSPLWDVLRSEGVQ